MKKFIYLYILGPAVGFKVLTIYLKRIFKKEISNVDFAYLCYYNLLINNKFSHVKEFEKVFKIKTNEGVCLYLRKFPSSDFQAIEQIWTDVEYAVIVDLLKKEFQHGDLRIVDAGANVGYSSVYLFTKLKHLFNLSIVPIEPSEDNIRMMEMNFKENSIIDYHIENAGLYNKTCFLDIVKDFRDGKDWSLQVNEVGYETSLKAIQINDILEKYNWAQIDFFKMDIEGAERFLFNDTNYASVFLNKIKVIAIEIHHEYNIKDHICESLRENNFYLFEHGELVIGINNYLLQHKN